MKMIPWQIEDYIKYYKMYGKTPNINNPKTMNEKILYRKRYQCRSSFFKEVADKYLVRNYVKNKIGSEYLINLVDAVSSNDVIHNIDKYRGCVIKPNHASGMVYIVPLEILEEDLIQLKKTIKKWMNTDYSKRHGELQYKNIEKKILVEEFIGDRGSLPVDYKIHVFNQHQKEFNYVLEVITDRADNKSKSTFFINNLEKSYSGDYVINSQEKLKIIEAISLSKTLLDDLGYARIDWYIIEEKLLFGEITLTPGAGLDRDIKGELDNIMGSYWALSA